MQEEESTKNLCCNRSERWALVAIVAAIMRTSMTNKSLAKVHDKIIGDKDEE